MKRFIIAGIFSMFLSLAFANGEKCTASCHSKEHKCTKACTKSGCSYSCGEKGHMCTKTACKHDCGKECKKA